MSETWTTPAWLCWTLWNGDPAPADPGTDWAVKARKRADHVLRAVVS